MTEKKGMKKKTVRLIVKSYCIDGRDIDEIGICFFSTGFGSILI